MEAGGGGVWLGWGVRRRRVIGLKICCPGDALFGAVLFWLAVGFCFCGG